MKISQKYIFTFSFIAFVFSGFSGLIYQSVWTRYLSLILGHAAFAQTLVLSLFMGGMALGAWWASKLSSRENFQVLKSYAIIEAIIGILGLVFLFVFVSGTDIVQTAILPSLESEALISMTKWAWAILLILPQCVLLGMTFPLLSAGLLRASENVNGEILGTLYFTNSIGAAVGALISTFALIPNIGLPGAMTTAGVINIMAAALVFAISTQETPSATTKPISAETEAGAEQYRYSRLILWCAFLTGLSSFVYEIAWVRMLSLALGSTTHAFEIMLSSFIAGLAIGSFWIRKRIDKHTEPLVIAGWAQLLMGVAALSTIFSYQFAFSGVEYLLKALSPTASGYFLFNLSSAAIAIAILFPTAFFAGMTLPVFTTCLLKTRSGEQAIGRVYAVNTIGAICGVFIAVHLLLPFLGLKSAILIAALTDIVLGMIIFKQFAETHRTRYLATICGGVLIVLFAALAPKLDPRVLASGVFRYQTAALKESTTVGYYRDGKTATISATIQGSQISIATNGKVDAGMQMRPDRPPASDEETMVMLGLMPALYLPEATQGATIGFGSGLSTHTILGNPRLKTLDTIEIESAIVEGAQIFGDRVKRAYTDPRSNIIIADAKTHFSGNNKKYDFIVSEPSNPWVNGVASLFSEEFYSFIPRHLKDNGVLVQWIQLYEIDTDLVMSILKGLEKHFEDYDAYFASTGDLIIVAKPRGVLGNTSGELLNSPNLLAELKVQGLSSLTDINLRYFTNKTMLSGVVEQSKLRMNSDFYPVVSHLAPKARFMRAIPSELLGLNSATVPYADLLFPEKKLSTNLPIADRDTPHLKASEYKHASILARAMLNGFTASAITYAPHRDSFQIVSLSKANCYTGFTSDFSLKAVIDVGTTVAAFAPAALARDALSSDWLGCPLSKLPAAIATSNALFSAIAQRDVEKMIATGRAVLATEALKSYAPIAEMALCSVALGLIKQQKYQEAGAFLQLHREVQFTAQNRALRLLLISMVEHKLQKSTK